MSTGTVEPKTNNGTAVATQQTRELTPFERTKGWLQSEKFHEAVALVLPKHLSAKRYLRIAITATMKNPKLTLCTQESILDCLMKLSEHGLEPDGRRAHLIPRHNSKKDGNKWIKVWECTLQLDYKGIAELVMRSGLVSNIHADVVCDEDNFEFDKGFITRHKIDFKKPRGEAYAVYAVVRMKDGTEKCDVMTKDEVYAIRNRSEGWKAFQSGDAKQSPWNPAEPVIEREMWKKTVFKRLSKWLPLSAEIRDMLGREDDDEAERVRLLDLQDPKTITTTATTKADALADLMQQRLQGEEDQTEGAPTGEESQETPEENAQDGATGEESQEQSTPAGESLAAEVAKKISSAIKIASDEPTMDDLVNEIDHLKNEQLRADLHKQLAERRQQLSALKARSGNKKSGQLPGT